MAQRFSKELGNFTSSLFNETFEPHMADIIKYECKDYLQKNGIPLVHLGVLENHMISVIFKIDVIIHEYLGYYFKGDIRLENLKIDEYGVIGMIQFSVTDNSKNENYYRVNTKDNTLELNIRFKDKKLIETKNNFLEEYLNSLFKYYM